MDSETASLQALGMENANLTTAAVCVYHTLIPFAKEALKGTSIPIAAVSTGFPAGNISLEDKITEIKKSVAAGAKEIDIVISRRHVLTQNWQALYDEVAAMRQACGPAHLKAILATGDPLEWTESLTIQSQLEDAALKIEALERESARTPDPAQIRADALREAAALIHRIADGYAADDDNALSSPARSMPRSSSIMHQPGTYSLFLRAIFAPSVKEILWKCSICSCSSTFPPLC